MNHHGSPSSAHDTIHFPPRELAADRKKSSACQLRQLLKGKTNFDCPIHSFSKTVRESNELMAQSHRNAFGGNLAKAFQETVKNDRLPDKCLGGPERPRR